MRHIFENMTKTKTARKNITILLLAIIPVVGVFAHYTASGSAQSVQQLQQQIDSLKEEISGSEARIQELRGREDTLENRLEILEAEIAQAEEELAKTKQEISATKQQIRETKQKIERLKDKMQENAKIIYKNGDASTIEILFSSDNFTDFINRQEYLERAKKNLNEASDEAKELQTSLKNEKKELEGLKTEQEGQKRRIASRINEQENLLTQTRGEESRYQEKLAKERKALEQANAQLQEELARRSSVYTGSVDFSGGSYPYPNACMNPYKEPQYINRSNCTARMGGYYDRQCTSYAFWRRGNMGRPVPGYWGNGGDWAYAAGQAGYRVNYTPEKGAIGVMGSSNYGHVFIVEKVVDGGRSVIASQYNVPNAQTNWEYGKYSVVKYTDLSGIQFIHGR